MVEKCDFPQVVKIPYPKIRIFGHFEVIFVIV